MKCSWKINFKSLAIGSSDNNRRFLNIGIAKIGLMDVGFVHLDTHWPSCQFYSWLGQ